MLQGQPGMALYLSLGSATGATVLQQPSECRHVHLGTLGSLKRLTKCHRMLQAIEHRQRFLASGEVRVHRLASCFLGAPDTEDVVSNLEHQPEVVGKSVVMGTHLLGYAHCQGTELGCRGQQTGGLAG